MVATYGGSALMSGLCGRQEEGCNESEPYHNAEHRPELRWCSRGIVGRKTALQTPSFMLIKHENNLSSNSIPAYLGV